MAADIAGCSPMSRWRRPHPLPPHQELPGTSSCWSTTTRCAADAVGEKNGDEAHQRMLERSNDGGKRRASRLATCRYAPRYVPVFGPLHRLPVPCFECLAPSLSRQVPFGSPPTGHCVTSKPRPTHYLGRYVPAYLDTRHLHIQHVPMRATRWKSLEARGRPFCAKRSARVHQYRVHGTHPGGQQGFTVAVFPLNSDATMGR